LVDGKRFFTSLGGKHGIVSTPNWHDLARQKWKFWWRPGAMPLLRISDLAFDLALKETLTSRSHDAAEKAPNQQPH
jgi:hypothetical protein